MLFVPVDLPHSLFQLLYYVRFAQILPAFYQQLRAICITRLQLTDAPQVNCGLFILTSFVIQVTIKHNCTISTQAALALSSSSLAFSWPDSKHKTITWQRLYSSVRSFIGYVFDNTAYFIISIIGGQFAPLC